MKTLLVEIDPTSGQALGVVTALGELAREQRLHVDGVSLVQVPGRPSSDALSVVQLRVVASITDADRRTPATAPAAQRLLREMGAAWDDMEPERTEDGRRFWGSALVGQGIHLTLVTAAAAVPAQGDQR